MGLGTKLTALMALIVLVVMSATSAASLHYQERSLKQGLRREVDGQALIASRAIASFIDDSLHEAAAVARTLPRAALAGRRTAEVEAHLARMLEVFPRFQNGIFVLDERGDFLTDYPVHPEVRGRSFAFRDYYRRTIQEGRGVVGAPYRSARTGNPVLTFTAPVRDARGRLVAILACSVDLLSQEALGGYRRQRYGDSGYLFVVDRSSHTLVLHPDDARLLTVISGRNALLEAAYDGFEGADETVNTLGVPMLLAVRRCPDTDWIVGVQIPLEEAYAPIAAARRWVVSGAAVAMALVIVLGAAAIRGVSRPLKQLDRAASRIAAALEAPEGAARPDARRAVEALGQIRSRDEIGQLARSFLHLEGRLEQTLGSLRQSADDWKRTFDSVHDAVLTLDPDGHVLRMNRTAERWFDVSERERRGEHVTRLLGGTAPGEWRAPGALVEHEKRTWCQDLEQPRGTFELTLAPIAHQGAVVGAVLIVSDVTERKRLELESLRVDRLESLAVLAGGIAHDFNNFLAAILGNLSVARDQAASDGALAEILGDAEQAALRAKTVTQQLLTFSKGGEPIKRRVSLGELARAATSFALRGSKVACELSVAPDLWPVEVDEGQMSQVVHNLVLNAVQAMPSGGTIRVRVENVPGGVAPAEGGGRAVRLCVEDHGVGIPADARHRIFDPYFTTKQMGNGLGLASAYSIVRRHGGRIDVESELGVGSRFTVLLPASEGAVEPRGVERAPRGAGRGRVLLMDDEGSVRRAASRMLARLGFEVVEAGDGAEAVARYGEARDAGAPFCAVILDLTVPGGTGGLEALARLRALDPAVNAIVSSGYSNDPVMADFRRHGFTGMVAKPYRMEDLRDALARATPS